MITENIKILLVEDESIIAKDVENILLNYGFKVVGIFSRAEDVINNVLDLKPDLILMDIVLKGQLDGIEAAKIILQKIQVPIIYLTAYADEKTIMRIIETVPYGYFSKPFEEKELYTWICTTLNKFKIDKQLKDKLKKSERDLKQIEYIASHDLQEPLRMIASYVRLLQKKYQGKIDSNADEFINFAVDGVNRMKDLISDLLQYTRIGKNDYNPEITDLNKTISEVIKVLNRNFNTKQFEITYDNLPLIKADRQHIKTLFYNLLSNSVKFNESEFCNIKISYSKNDGHILFSITDNGLGIDEQYSNKVFDMFQKLHENEKYPGTGIGLAICRKIVELYNGELWFDSNSNQGTTFHFTIETNGKYSTG